MAKRQWPMPVRQRQASARGPGRRLDANAAKVGAQYCNRMVVDAAERGDLDEALMRMQKLRSDGLKPSSEAFNALLKEFLRTKDLDAVEEWLGKATASALYPELVGLGATAEVYHSLVTSLAEGGHLPKAETYARDMQGKGLELDAGSYQALIRACLDIGECRRAHAWCVEMTQVGHKKPNKALMKNLVWALTDAGNTTSANHWLKFMAEESSDLDRRTYEHVRAAHPLDIVPTGLSGEVGVSVAPIVRPATVGAERRKAEQPAKALAESCPQESPRTCESSRQTTPRPAWLSSPRRSAKGVRLQPITGGRQLQMPSKTGGLEQADRSASKQAVQSWLANLGTGDAWLARKGFEPKTGGAG